MGKLFMLLFFSSQLFGQTYSSVINDSEIYDFLNWMIKSSKKYDEEPRLRQKQININISSWHEYHFIKPDTISDKLICRHTYLFNPRNELDSIFNEQDKAFLYEQFRSINDSVWHTSFKSSKLLKRKKQIRINKYYYSIPLFSVNKDTVVIMKSYHCGMLCAHKGYFVYQRLDNGGWKCIKAFNISIS